MAVHAVNYKLHTHYTYTYIRHVISLLIVLLIQLHHQAKSCLVAHPNSKGAPSAAREASSWAAGVFISKNPWYLITNRLAAASNGVVTTQALAVMRCGGLRPRRCAPEHGCLLWRRTRASAGPHPACCNKQAAVVARTCALAPALKPGRPAATQSPSPDPHHPHPRPSQRRRHCVGGVARGRGLKGSGLQQ